MIGIQIPLTESLANRQGEIETLLQRGAEYGFEGRVSRVREHVSTAGTPDTRTVVSILDGCLSIIWIGSFFSRSLASLLDLHIKRLWPQHY